MAKVKALYSYTYDYEGSKISFTSGDEFQLLAKVNNDWWHVRRWVSQGPQDIYIPAVYVKEVGDDANPLYQNMSDLKKQVEEFKKKESSTPPPPTARKPRHDRAGSVKTKTSTAVVVSSSEHKTEAESVADRAKKHAENLQAKKKQDDEFPAVVRTGSGSPLVSPQRSQSTQRNENPVSGQTAAPVEGGTQQVAKTLAVEMKPRSRSINVKPTERREKELTGLHNALQTDPQAAAKSGGKTKLPPPVLPKGKTSSRPKSMVMVSPTEGHSTEDPFASVLQSQLTEQMKKVRSVTSVGATTATGDQKISHQEEASLANGKVRLYATLCYIT